MRAVVINTVLRTICIHRQCRFKCYKKALRQIHVQYQTREPLARKLSPVCLASTKFIRNAEYSVTLRGKCASSTGCYRFYYVTHSQLVGDGNQNILLRVFPSLQYEFKRKLFISICTVDMKKYSYCLMLSGPFPIIGTVVFIGENLREIVLSYKYLYCETWVYPFKGNFWKKFTC